MNEERIDFSVALDDVKHVIGRGGTKIKEYETTFSCRIKLIPGDTEDGRVPGFIRGRMENCEKAKETIMYDLERRKLPSPHKRTVQSCSPGGLPTNMGGFNTAPPTLKGIGRGMSVKNLFPSQTPPQPTVGRELNFGGGSVPGRGRGRGRMTEDAPPPTSSFSATTTKGSASLNNTHNSDTNETTHFHGFGVPQLPKKEEAKRDGGGGQDKILITEDYWAYGGDKVEFERVPVRTDKRQEYTTEKTAKSNGAPEEGRGGDEGGWGGGFGGGGFKGGFSCPTQPKAHTPSSSEDEDLTAKKDPTEFDLRGLGFGQYKDMQRAESERWKGLPTVLKHFYKEHEQIHNMKPEEVALLRKSKNDIQVDDLTGNERDIPNPIYRFEHAFHAYPDLLGQVAEQGFKEPSPIQCQMWPIAMSGFDVIGIAQTGSGKTLGFLFPAFVHIDLQTTAREDRGGPTCLILTPTRELAQQIHSEVKKYHYKKIRSACVYGGGCRQSQVDLCNLGVDIVIATPGRLYDLMCDRVILMKSVSFLVLDEADRMLDMGFEPQIRRILQDIRPDRQTVMTSATWPASVRKLGNDYTKDAILAVIGSLDLTACTTVTQKVKIVEAMDKAPWLYQFLGNLSSRDKVLVFVGRKATASRLSADLKRNGKKCQSLHGDRTQPEREEAMKDFKKGRVDILVATDVASRGLDIMDITYIVNYDFPGSMEEYVHRVGRTGRAGRKGVAVSLLTRRDDGRMTPALVKLLLRSNQEISPELQTLADEFQDRLSSLGPHDFACPSLPELRRRDGERQNTERQRRRPREFCDPFTGEVVGTIVD